MTNKLLVNENTFSTKSQADARLKGSARAADLWAALETTPKRRALISSFRKIEGFIFEGAATGIEYASSAVVASGGTTYSVGDVATATGGAGQAAQFKVTGASGGVVDTVEPVDEALGGYTTTPTNPVATTGAGDNGLTLTVAYKTQTASFPRTGLTDQYGVALDSFVVPVDVRDAQIELGFDISQDFDVESSEGTGSNTKSVKAGSAEVEFFRPTDGTRLPSIVQTLLNPFLGSASGASSGSNAFGTGCSSQFDDGDTFKRTEGFP